MFLTLLNECQIPEVLFTDSVCDKLETIAVCLEAVGDDTADTRTITVANRYSDSMVLEVITASRAVLLNTYDTLLSKLNSFNLNYFKILEKYQEVLYNKIRSQNLSIPRDTYSYPIKEYPNDVRSVRVLDFDMHNFIAKMKNKDYKKSDASSDVTDMIKKFGEQMIGKKPDMNDIIGSVKKKVTSELRGSQVKTPINEKNFNLYVNSFHTYKELLTDLKRARANIDEYYEKIIHAYQTVTRAISEQMERNQYDYNRSTGRVEYQDETNTRPDNKLTQS